MAGGYPLPPTEPPGGWKNDAQWIGNVEEWAREMMKMGFTPDDLAGIYKQHIGEKFPKNLMNSIRANNWLFPGANMLYEYDLDNHMKRRYAYTSKEGSRPQGEWEAMAPSEIDSVNQYFKWRDDPAHEWMIKATIDSSGPEGNPYAAWLRQWGNYYKDPNYTPPKTPGAQYPTRDIHRRPGYDSSGRPITTSTPGTTTPTPVTPTVPVTPTPIVPGGGGPKTPQGSSENYQRLSEISGPSSISSARGLGIIDNNTKFATDPGMSGTRGWGDITGPTQRRLRLRL